MSDTPSKQVGLYRLCLQAGTGQPGAKTRHLELLVNAATGTVTGAGSQTQAVTPPGGNIPINNITGIIHGAGFGNVTKLIGLRGEAYITLPPPAIGTFQMPFSAGFGVDNNWNGKGGWAIGSADQNEDVPVKSVKCD
jgi:Domain of unknown function (DUF1842)